MAILFMDNFQAYGLDETAADDMYVERSAEVTLAADPDTLLSTTAMAFATAASADATLRFTLPGTAPGALGMGCRFYATSLPTSTAHAPEIFSFREVADATHVHLELMTTGQLRIVRGDEGGTVLGTSTLSVITPGAWQHIEMKVVISDTIGTTEVRVDDVIVAGLTLTGQDTANSATVTVAQVAIARRADAVAGPTAYYYKDLIIWDILTGVNDDFLGSVQIVTLGLASDVALNWTPSTGSTGFDLLNDEGPNDTTTILAGSTPPSAYEGTLGDLTADIISVSGLMVLGRHKKSDSDSATVQMSMESAASTDLGADNALTEADAYYYDISELDPATAAAWLPAAVDAATLKINRTT